MAVTAVWQHQDSAYKANGVVQTLAQRCISGKAGGVGILQYSRNRMCQLSLSRCVSVQTSQVGGIRWLDLDSVEQRYMLSAAAGSTVEAFDVLAGDAGSGHQRVQLPPLFTIKRSHPAAHRYQVTSLVWYPVDTGLFVTGSADQDVKVWDTNMLEVACTFNCPDKVMAVAMSCCATSHALIAVGTQKPGVMLADVASGAFTHTLTGHSSGTWSICWSPGNEHQLFTGDAAGEVRLWDVRRSGTRALLDMAVTQKSKRQPAAPARAAAAPQQPGGASRVGSKRKAPAAPLLQQAGQGPTHRRPNPSSFNPNSERGAEPQEGPTYGVRPTGRATKPLAHEGPVTAIHATADGLNLVTAACDNRLRLWDAQHMHHRMVHYSDTFNRGAFPKRPSGTPDGRYVFFPRGDDIQAADPMEVSCWPQVFDVDTGQQLALLSQGHYDTVTACVYSPNTQQLWSAGTDGVILVWEPWTESNDLQDQMQQQQGSDKDWWLAAASGRRAQPPLGSQGAAAGGSVVTTGVRRTAPDVDAWSEDADML